MEVDFFLVLTVIGLVLFGLIMVYSASYIFAQERFNDGFVFIRRQLVYAMIGLVALWIGFRIDHRVWLKLAYPAVITAILLLGLILVPGVGHRVGGARRWLDLGFTYFQPGEFAKFAVIVFVARQLSVKQERIKKFTAGVLSHFVVPLPVLLLLLVQPDFGTTTVIFGITFLLMFLAGVPIKQLFGVFAVGSIVGAWLIAGSAYRRGRLLGFLDPWSDPEGKGFQIIQSMVGFHNGGVWGVGLGNGKEKLFFLPEAHNDFIFSVIGEETGFVGVALVVAAYIFLIYRGLKIAWDSTRQRQDSFGTLLAAGITLAIGFQGFVNMGVVLGLLPTKGLTLPFISYGGSALIVDLFAIGVLLSIGKGLSPFRNEGLSFARR